MAYETEAALYAGITWDQGPCATNEKVNEREVVRTTKVVHGPIRATFLEYLDTITTVTDPHVNSKAGVPNPQKFTGLYRVANRVWDARSETYTQVLRLGWATTVLTGSHPSKTPNDECLVAQAADSRKDQRSMTLLWKNLAASPVGNGTAATLAVQGELRTQGSFASPTIQGETKTGTWAIGAIAEQQQADGSYWVTAACTLATSIKDKTTAQTLAALQALTPLRGDVRDIENPFGLEGGFTAPTTPETVPGPGRRPTEGIADRLRVDQLPVREAADFARGRVRHDHPVRGVPVHSAGDRHRRGHHIRQAARPVQWALAVKPVGQGRYDALVAAHRPCGARHHLRQRDLCGADDHGPKGRRPDVLGSLPCEDDQGADDRERRR
jgi:hypothetical protein